MPDINVFSGSYVASGSYTYEEARNLGININKPDVSRAPTNQDPTTDTRQKRIDLAKSLKLIPYERLDESQNYANSGDTMPIVFCKVVDNKGGTWVSPTLIDSASADFAQTFVYLVSSGELTIPSAKANYFLGKNNVKDLDTAGLIAGTLTFSGEHTDDPTVCPLSGYDVTCTHNVFRLLLDPLGTSIGDTVQFRSIDDYSTEARIKVLPIYPQGYASPTLLETYNIRVQRTNNNTGTTTTVGTITTSNSGTASSLFTDTYSTGSYTHTFDIQSVAVAQTVKPEYILIEFRQENDFPESVDRKASYTDITLLIVEGNLFDTTKLVSAPADLKQLHTFVENGIRVNNYRTISGTTDISAGITSTVGASNIFGDLVAYFFKYSNKYTNLDNVLAFDIFNAAATAVFHQYYKIYFNGVVSSATNFLSYAQTLAPMFLCGFFDISGVYALEPLLPITSSGQINTAALTPLETFNDTETTPEAVDNTIIAGTYEKTYFDAEERLPFQVVVSWRSIRKTGMETTRTATVRYSDYASDVPEIEYDMTEFCTTKDHAVLFAKYTLATRRYSTHRISFQTARNVLNSSGLVPLNLIRIELHRVNSEGDSRTEIEHYLVDSTEESSSGLVTITGTHFPLNVGGASIISNSIVSGSFEVIT